MGQVFVVLDHSGCPGVWCGSVYSHLVSFHKNDPFPDRSSDLETGLTNGSAGNRPQLADDKFSSAAFFLAWTSWWKWLTCSCSTFSTPKCSQMACSTPVLPLQYWLRIQSICACLT